MWIISENGLFNLDAISYVGETPYGTFALCGNRQITISKQKIQHEILYGLENNLKILEVE